MKQDASHASRFWRSFWTLFGAAVLSVLAAAPMGLELVRPILAQAGPPSIPLPLIVLIGAVQNLALLALFVGLGLKLSSNLGLGPKLLEKWLSGSLTRAELWSTAKIGVITGLGVSAILLPAILTLAQRLPGIPFVSAARIVLWKRFLICFYGGVYEEIFTRLFLLSLFAWLLNRSWRKGARLSSGAFWIANVISTILFGLGHLPSVSFVMPITPLVVVGALLLNGVAGLAFGWLYRKMNLEAAMVAHFTTDFVLYVIGPYFLMR